MKVYSLPEELAYPDPDYSAPFDLEAERAREDAHSALVKAWLLENGYPGEHTGALFSKQHADGYARYMMGDGPRSALFHLPYGDKWHSPDVQYIPKREILKRIAQQAKLAEMFSKAA